MNLGTNLQNQRDVRFNQSDPAKTLEMQERKIKCVREYHLEKMRSNPWQAETDGE